MPAPSVRTEAPARAQTASLRPLARLLENAWILLRDSAVASIAARTARTWVVVRLDRGVTESEPATRWMGGWVPGPSPLAPLLEALARIEDDTEVRGVFVRVGAATVGWSKLVSLARALERVQARGKRVVVYATHGANAAAWLGALADRFWMSPEGRLDLIGVRLETLFVRGLLDRLGVRPLVLQAGKYKGIAEVLERDSMSPQAREALEAVIDDFFATLVRGLARRAGDEAQARRWIDGGPYLAEQAVDLGLVDELVYPDRLAGRLRALEGDSEASPPVAEQAVSGEPDGPRPLPVASYLRLTRPRFRWRPLLRPARRIVVVPLLGTIGQSLARIVSTWLHELRQRDDVAAVVLRIDSPGGDPGSSDLIWRAVRHLRERKPVVASMGDTAASGGYYAAMGANAIVAEPTSLTGSIGVVLAGVELGETLAEHGIRFDGVQRGRHAGIFSLTATRSDEERALLQDQVDRLYATFVSKAAEGRGVSREAMEELAQGRVWSGAAAAERGLIDATGGLVESLERARALAGLGPDEAEILRLPAAPPAWRRLISPEDPYDAGSSLETQWNHAPQLWCPIRIPLR